MIRLPAVRIFSEAVYETDWETGVDPARRARIVLRNRPVHYLYLSRRRLNGDFVAPSLSQVFHSCWVFLKFGIYVVPKECPPLALTCRIGVDSGSLRFLISFCRKTASTRISDRFSLSWEVRAVCWQEPNHITIAQFECQTILKEKIMLDTRESGMYVDIDPPPHLITH